MSRNPHCVRAGRALLLLSAFSFGCKSPSPTGTPTGVNVTGVNVTASATSLIVTGTVQLTATVVPSGSAQGVTWTSSNVNIATVDQSGTVTGVTQGSVTITATSTAAPTIQGSIQLTVAGCPLPRAAASSINANTTWQDWIADPICFDYEAKQSVTVNGALLTIEPGVVVGFDQGRLLVTATAGLNAAGTAAKPIRISGITPTRGIWDGIQMEITQHASNRIENTTIEYGGGHGAGGGIQPANLALVQGAQTVLVNVTLQESAGYGLDLHFDSSIPGGYQGGSITKNALGAAYVWASVAHLLGSAPTPPLMTGNDRDDVDVVADDLDSNVSWNALGEPYHILANPKKFGVQGTLTLGPGAVLEFEQDQAMTVSGGSLMAMGTAQAPIRLTGAQHTRGSWRGLQIEGGEFVLDHVVIEYGGGPGGSGTLQPADLKLGTGSDPTRLRLRNTVLQLSAGYGLFTRASDVSVDEFTGNTLTANALGPAYIAATHVNAVTANGSYSGNDFDRLTVETTGGSISQETTVHDIGIPYQLIGKELEIDHTSFTIEKGVEMFLASDVDLNVRNSTFTAVGTMTDRIRLQGDGAKWQGILLFESNASFDYVDFLDAGSKKFGGVNEVGTVVMESAGTNESLASFTGNVTSANALFALVFGFGPTIARGCIAPTYIPPPDKVSDHCQPG